MDDQDKYFGSRSIWAGALGAMVFGVLHAFFFGLSHWWDPGLLLSCAMGFALSLWFFVLRRHP